MVERGAFAQARGTALTRGGVPGDAGATRPGDGVAVALAVALAAAWRIPAIRGDLWFDEIWSLGFARNARSALESSGSRTTTTTT